jgi:homoserine kinase
VAGVCSSNVEAVETEFGFEIEIYKHIKREGIGSSAASSGAFLG